jgi:hypothetical protein
MHVGQFYVGSVIAIAYAAVRVHRWWRRKR